MRSFIYRIGILGLVVLSQVLLSVLGVSSLVIALFLSSMILIIGIWMAKLHGCYRMGVGPVLIAGAVMTMCFFVFELSLIRQVTVELYAAKSAIASLPLYFYLSYLLEVEDKRRAFRNNVKDIFIEISREIGREVSSAITSKRQERSEMLENPPSINDLHDSQERAPDVAVEEQPKNTADQDKSKPSKNKRKVILD
ncbi:hypothetical protein [Vibrio vulnificus]|uniref:hypothetical protein n=1 Tax=Vibrio vulnificus TaxID=672 RepID=UPI003242B5F0